MSTRSKMFAWSAVGLLLAALPVSAKGLKKPVHPAKPKTVPSVETATIENTGSTNTAPYTITIKSNGALTGADGGHATLSKEQTRQLFDDLAAAMPLTELPVRHGMRSASFGTRTFVTYRGQRSPDLSLPGSETAKALKADVDAVTKSLNVGGPRRPEQP